MPFMLASSLHVVPLIHLSSKLVCQFVSIQHRWQLVVQHRICQESWESAVTFDRQVPLAATDECAAHGNILSFSYYEYIETTMDEAKSTYSMIKPSILLRKSGK